MLLLGRKDAGFALYALLCKPRGYAGTSKSRRLALTFLRSAQQADPVSHSAVPKRKNGSHLLKGTVVEIWIEDCHHRATSGEDANRAIVRRRGVGAKSGRGWLCRPNNTSLRGKGHDCPLNVRQRVHIKPIPHSGEVMQLDLLVSLRYADSDPVHIGKWNVEDVLLLGITIDDMPVRHETGQVLMELLRAVCRLRQRRKPIGVNHHGTCSCGLTFELRCLP
jgi:hypothetical protein